MFYVKAKCQVVGFVVFSLSIGGLVLRAQMPSEAGRRDWASLLPDGEGKGLVLGTCTQCHNPTTIVLQRKSARAWETSVSDMISRGAQINVDEIAPISSYLARNFGPDSPRVVTPNELQAVSRAVPPRSINTPESLPDGPGKAIVLNSCTSCHELSKTTEARKDVAGWRGNVRDMVRLGAKLQANEEGTVVAYLAKHFGRPESPVGVSSSAEQKQSLTSMGGMARPVAAADPARLLPDDEGKALILATCVQCHASLVYVLGLRKDPEGWRRSVDDMIARGAQVTPTEAEIITAYLAKHMAGKKVE